MNAAAISVPRPTRISEHVYWLPPAPPDRPSLCAVVGGRRTLMLDGGSSRPHARELLDGLAAEGAAAPFAVAYTHSHWDHVFGGVEAGAPIVAHELTARRLLELAERDWSDEALDARVASGEASPAHAAHVKEELPAPRHVEVAPADVVFRDRLELDLGGVCVTIHHVGGDHCDESSVMYVEPDRLLFLGDAICASPYGALTAAQAIALADRLLAFPAELYVEGHHPAVESRADFANLVEKLRTAERAVREGIEIERPDEDTAEFLDAFRAGVAHR
jgi:glyoxylase-like metal-dependent hydrolase (beta-lactamase superfamily II)